MKRVLALSLLALSSTSVRGFSLLASPLIKRAVPALSTVSFNALHVSSTQMSAMKSDDEWRSILSPEQFQVLRGKGTEFPGSSPLNKMYPKEGVFKCAGCDADLYAAPSKFDSGCGWPAFYEGLPGAVTEVPDADGRRTEIVCTNCGGHLGHVFKGEGFPTPTNERHCVNGVCLRFDEAAKPKM
mmetsp:Transcript_34847/g.70438  ORF Transcript_34847/g.70438 Transcript_34847/m.70438 type:complete len:184 (-) Transcript_34847:103-654(-)